MGGLGALDYAARHPGMFAVAASFSGIVHTRLSSNESQGYLDLIKSQGEDPLAVWGAPDANVDTWKQHNPYDLAAELKGVRPLISAGNGRPGPLDPTGANQDSIETSIGAETGHSPAAYSNSGWMHTLTCTGQVRITGCIGNANCTARDR
jgi:S-formylglutathione hydrolase FrmB